MSKKGAVKTGGTAGRKRNADQAMAARIANTARTTARCPICNNIVHIPMDNHIRTCR